MIRPRDLPQMLRATLTRKRVCPPSKAAFQTAASQDVAPPVENRHGQEQELDHKGSQLIITLVT